MYFEKVQVETPSDALSHLGELHCTLEGMSELACDMANSPNVPNKNLDLFSFMLTYCADVLHASEDCLFEFYKEHRDAA